MRYSSSLAAAAVIFLVMQSGSAFAQQPADETTRIDSSEMRTLAAEADRLSTREARLQVQPLNWDETRGEGMRIRAALEPEDATPAGPPGSAPGGAPDPAAAADAEALYPEEWRGLREADAARSGPTGVDYGTQDVFTQYCENCSGTILNQPQVAIGKLFTSSGSCSASVVSGTNVIVTAAHCCYNRGSGNWIGGWSFAPAYRDGFAPYGLFNWSGAIILNSWINVGDRKSDVCLIRLAKNSNGKGVNYYTGWLGRSWNYGTTQVHHALGYPGNIGSANKLELCVSESFNPSSGCGGASVLNTGCSMTYGSSGGPWVRHYRGGNWVNAVVSGYDGTSCTGSFGGTFNGPRFTSANIGKLCSDFGC